MVLLSEAEVVARKAKAADIVLGMAIDKLGDEIDAVLERIDALERQADADDVDDAYVKALVEIVDSQSETIAELEEERDEWRDAFHNQAAYSVEIDTKNGWLSTSLGALKEENARLMRQIADLKNGLWDLERKWAWNAANLGLPASVYYGEAELCLRELRRGNA